MGTGLLRWYLTPISSAARVCDLEMRSFPSGLVSLRRVGGNVGLKNREGTGWVGECETAEIGYWTAVAARGRGVAPAAVRAVTGWVFGAFAGTSLRQIMLVYDVGNPASCRVAEKAGYPFRELSPARPPHWFTDGHIDTRADG